MVECCGYWGWGIENTKGPFFCSVVGGKRRHASTHNPQEGPIYGGRGGEGVGGWSKLILLPVGNKPDPDNTFLSLTCAQENRVSTPPRRVEPLFRLFRTRRGCHMMFFRINEGDGQ